MVYETYCENKNRSGRYTLFINHLGFVGPFSYTNEEVYSKN